MIQTVAPPTQTVTAAELDAVERALQCRLPADYRTFLATFGAGLLDLDPYTGMDIWHIWTPTEIMARTPRLRTNYREGEGDARGRLFWYFGNAVAVLKPADVERLVFIAWSENADQAALLPGSPPRYIMLPRQSQRLVDGGSTMETFLDSLDPRLHIEPRERWIVEQGVARHDDGRPTGTPPLYTFTPDTSPVQDGPWLDQTILWEQAEAEEDDGLTRRAGEPRPPSASIAYLLDSYPVLRLLESLALGDPSLRFEVRAGDDPNGLLTIPQYDATLHVSAGEGLWDATVQVQAPHEWTAALWHWLRTEAQRLGYTVPDALGA